MSGVADVEAGLYHYPLIHKAYPPWPGKCRRAKSKGFLKHGAAHTADTARSEISAKGQKHNSGHGSGEAGTTNFGTQVTSGTQDVHSPEVSPEIAEALNSVKQQQAVYRQLLMTMQAELYHLHNGAPNAKQLGDSTSDREANDFIVGSGTSGPALECRTGEAEGEAATDGPHAEDGPIDTQALCKVVLQLQRELYETTNENEALQQAMERRIVGSGTKQAILQNMIVSLQQSLYDVDSASAKVKRDMEATLSQRDEEQKTDSKNMRWHIHSLQTQLKANKDQTRDMIDQEIGKSKERILGVQKLLMEAQEVHSELVDAHSELVDEADMTMSKVQQLQALRKQDIKDAEERMQKLRADLMIGSALLPQSPLSPRQHTQPILEEGPASSTAQTGSQLEYRPTPVVTMSSQVKE